MQYETGLPAGCNCEKASLEQKRAHYRPGSEKKLKDEEEREGRIYARREKKESSIVL